MTSIALSLKHIEHKVKSASLPRFNWKAVYVVGVFVSLMLLVFYIYQINQITREYYLIKDYNKQMDNILSDNRVLEDNLSENDFLGQAMNKANQLGFEKITDVTYDQILNGSLASAK